MTFGADLQQPSSHRSLLQLQDAEIQLLELIKKCIHQRVKSDREYANSLTVIINHAQKLETMGSTPLFQLWSSIVKETEGLIGLLRDHAEKVSTKAVDKLVHIISEKRTARKFYNDERLRVDNEFNKMKEDVNKLRQDYEKSVSKQIQDRLKYEDLVNKGTVGKKLEDAKSRLNKTSLKLHKVHNDYVVALHEVTLQQQNYLGTILPGILDYQEEVQKCLVTQCKSVLDDYAALSDLSTPDHRKHFDSICNLVQKLSPEAEYQGFTQEHKTEQIVPSTFAFDMELLQSYKGNLQSNELAVDNLTIEHIYHSHSKVKEQLTDCQQKVSAKQSLLTAQKEQMAKMQSEREDLDEMQRNSYGIHKRAVLDLEREIQETQCKQSVLQDLDRMYQDKITALGGKDPPLGIDFDDSSIFPPANNYGRDKRKDSSPDKKRENSVQSKKKDEQSPASPDPVKNGDTNDEDVFDSSSGSATQSDGPSRNFANNIQGKVNDLFSKLRKPSTGSSPVPPRPPAKDFLKDDCSYIDTDVQQNRVKQELEAMHKGDSAPSNDNNFVRASGVVDGYQPNMMIPDPDRKLDEEEWFHGVLPREEVQRLLTTDGDYLVRESKNRKTGEIQYVLSVFWADHKHFIIQGQDNGWRFEGEQYNTVQELIVSQHNGGQPVTRKSGAILKRPIVHETWELRNDDIVLGQKIGNGNFGDVFKGTYKKNNLEVAVKTCRETLSEDAKKKFLQEGRILKQYEHKNIVRFIGIAAQRHPVMIVMEFVSGGALLTFLKKQGAQQTKRQLIRMCDDASAGMAYLESRNCIHRDLAARNCLVGKSNVVKISDFGMSREEEEYTVSGGLKQIPIKWTAPEALNFGTYTSACDVWSFGVLMWEVFSFGQSPYPGLTNTQARERVDDGYRMPMPEGTPPQAYDLMLEVWDQEPKKRPQFADVHKRLERIHKMLPFR